VTAQVHDRVRLAEAEYDVLCVNGGPLFEPAAYGLRPAPMHTGCVRGYFCLYHIEVGQLMLAELHIRTFDDLYPPITGTPAEQEPLGSAKVYRGLRLGISLSGSHLVGKDFDRAHYVPMGFQSPDAYRAQLRLGFEGGRLLTSSTIPPA